jgi:hypothetical protein
MTEGVMSRNCADIDGMASQHRMLGLDPGITAARPSVAGSPLPVVMLRQMRGSGPATTPGRTLTMRPLSGSWKSRAAADGGRSSRKGMGPRGTGPIPPLARVCDDPLEDAGPNRITNA